MKKSQFYVRYNIVYEGIKMGWGEYVKAQSKDDAKNIIKHKYKDSDLDILEVSLA